MAKESKGNFISGLFSSLFGGNDADAEKKRQLKAIAKKLSKNKFNKLYKYSGNLVLPAMGKLFYDLYKALFPLQSMFNSIQNKNWLKQIVIDYSIPENIKKLEESLSEENIRSVSKELPVNKLKEQVEERLSQFSDFFTLERITKIDSLYKQMQGLMAVSTYDYYFFLKKFDKTLHENDFSQSPHFENVNAEYVSEDLKEFIESIWDAQLASDWTELFKIIKTFKGQEPVPLNTWKKITARIQQIKYSGALEMIIQLSSANPSYVPKIQPITSNIVEPYLDKVKSDVENTVNTIIESQRSAKQNDFASQLFGNTEIQGLANYTEARNPTFSHKGLNTFVNAQALAYTKAFLLEVVKKDFREYYDVVIVRGKWDSQSLTAQVSDCYNALLATSEKITAFDGELADEGPIGIKIKTLLPKTERDNGAKNIINRLVTDANDAAYEYIMESTRNIITIGKIIKTFVEDLQKQKPTLVSNWKELEHFLDVPLKDFSVNLYKKIYLFTSLIKTCVIQGEN